MFYDLDTLEENCRELGFSVSRSTLDALYVEVLEGVILEFSNLRESEDSYVGFQGTPWHSHDRLMLMTGNVTSVELDELDLIQAIKSGAVLIVEEYLGDALKDRWIVHKGEKMDVQHMKPGEEIRIRSRS